MPFEVVNFDRRRMIDMVQRIIHNRHSRYISDRNANDIAQYIFDYDYDLASNEYQEEIILQRCSSFFADSHSEPQSDPSTQLVVSQRRQPIINNYEIQQQSIIPQIIGSISRSFLTPDNEYSWSSIRQRGMSSSEISSIHNMIEHPWSSEPRIMYSTGRETYPTRTLSQRGGHIDMNQIIEQRRNSIWADMLRGIEQISNSPESNPSESNPSESNTLYNNLFTIDFSLRPSEFRPSGYSNAPRIHEFTMEFSNQENSGAGVSITTLPINMITSLNIHSVRSARTLYNIALGIIDNDEDYDEDYVEDYVEDDDDDHGSDGSDPPEPENKSEPPIEDESDEELEPISEPRNKAPTCIICCEKPVGIVGKCGHVSSCQQCSMRMTKREYYKCPVCRVRTKSSKLIKLYF